MARVLFLREPRLSRNRNFSAHQDPRFERAIALDRRLRALLAALERARAEEGRVRIDRGLHAGRPAVRVIVETARGRQASFLLEPEWEIFVSHPSVADHLAALHLSSVAGGGADERG